MAKVYVSIPISGRNIHTVMIESEKVKEYLSRLGHTPVTPLRRMSGNEPALCVLHGARHRGPT